MSEQEIMLNSADQAASTVLAQAMQAAAQGTFPVGGCIVDNHTGRVIYALHNNVLKTLSTTNKLFTFDPTAHGERQLVYWYFANREVLQLPDPQHLTIVTTLDPCAMCAGTLLSAGFNVAVVAIDDFAGINYNESFSFNDLPLNLREKAKNSFGYYACGDKSQDPSIYVREYVGSKSVAFNNTRVSAANLMACGSIFQASVNTVRDNSSDFGKAPSELTDPATLPADSPIKQVYKSVCPQAFSLKLNNFRIPDNNLYKLLLDLKESTPNAQNACAFIDPFGNLIVAFADTFAQSPVHAAFMNVTQVYAQVRFKLMNNSATEKIAENTLTHPKYGTFVFLYAPDPTQPNTVMTLGAYGSTMEGPVPQIFPANFLYYLPPQAGDIMSLTSLIMNLPPFYTELAQLSVMQTAITQE